MRLEKIIQIGLISAFSLSTAVLTSCDSSSGSSSPAIFPEAPKAGDIIEIKGLGGPTIEIIDGNNLTYVTDGGSLPARYDYVSSGSSYLMDLDFEGMQDARLAVIAMNQAIANPDSSLNGLIFSKNPTNAELNFFIRAVDNSSVDVTLDFDDDFNLFIQDSFRLKLPKSGKGTVENIISGEGIVLILGNGGKLVAVQEDGSERQLRFKYKKNAGVNYIDAL